MYNEPSSTLSFTILEEAQTAFIVYDTTLTLIYANPAAEELLSQSKQRLYQQNLQSFATQFNLDPESIKKLFIDHISFTETEVTLSVDNRPTMVDLSASIFALKAQHYAIIEMRSIGHQKRINQVYYQEHQQKAAQELIRGLAHEIKNPLGGLRGAAQLLEIELPTPELKEFTQIIIEQADRLSTLVNRLLGPQKLGVKRIHNIHSVLESVRKLICIDLPPNIQLNIDYDPSIPDFEMQQDQLQQAFLNIVQNAVQALKNKPEKHRITLRTRTINNITINGCAQRLAIEVKVIDTGPGVPEEIKDTLFYPMVTGRKDGTGLGLSIAQELIKQHQGRIELTSSQGHTEFAIYLPI